MLVDVNVLAIFFVEDHPGYPYIEPVVQRGIEGRFVLLLPSILPFRVVWVLSTKWGVPRRVAEELVGAFVRGQTSPVYFGLNQPSIQEAFALALDLHHDVYDCFYLAGAHQMQADSILTTDARFEKLCSRLSFPLSYENPVPVAILKEFSEFQSA